ncbi:MAG TPA: hypothetical protein VLK25_06510 [Allosphingosinicella sp.]|nr:hypothetical protein [Allosphingosinicella sp.]
MLAFALQAVVAFNLICTGTYTTERRHRRLDHVVSQPRPFTIVYRVDLTGARYCVDACTSIKPLAEVSESAIVFEDTSILFGQDDGVLILMDRRTGRYIGNSNFLDTVRHSGRCEQAPFGGFPETSTPQTAPGQ